MKYAVIVAGDFRECAIARDYWPFLEDDMDIFFSTWSTTEDKSIVTEDRVEGALRRKPVACLIEDIEPFSKLYNPQKMARRWSEGVRLVVESGVKYDAVILCRPDVCLNFLGNSMTFAEFLLVMKKDVLYGVTGPVSENHPLSSAYLNPEHPFMQDMMFISSLEVLKKFVDNIKIDKFVDIHKVLYDVVVDNSIKHAKIPVLFEPTIVRNTVHELKEITFAGIRDSFMVWLNRKIASI